MVEKLRSLGVVPFSEEKVDPPVEIGGSWKVESGKNGSGGMSYASVVRKNECLAEETIWL